MNNIKNNFKLKKLKQTKKIYTIFKSTKRHHPKKIQ